MAASWMRLTRRRWAPAQPGWRQPVAAAAAGLLVAGSGARVIALIDAIAAALVKLILAEVGCWPTSSIGYWTALAGDAAAAAVAAEGFVV